MLGTAGNGVTVPAEKYGGVKMHFTYVLNKFGKLLIQKLFLKHILLIHKYM
jgi:hypothetical protein